MISLLRNSRFAGGSAEDLRQAIKIRQGIPNIDEDTDTRISQSMWYHKVHYANICVNLDYCRYLNISHILN